MSTGLVAGSDDQTRGFRRIVELLIWLVVAPTVMLLAIGILMLVFWQARLNLVFGILVVTLVGCLTTGAVLALVLLRREAQLSKLQLDFVSKVSHELRTPLTAIRMFVEMLQDKSDNPDDVKVCTEVLQNETSRLSERIERLLDWGRMEAGRRVYELQPGTVEEVVKEAVEGFESVTASSDAAVHVHLEDDLPEINVDRGAMVDALLNLLSNAVKYSEQPHRIDLSATADANRVRISITDSGIGIPRSEHGRIFQKFYRLDDRLSRAAEGSGLGLSIVRHVVRGHGGRVVVNSHPGEGSTFTIVLPRLAASEVAQ